MAPGSPSFPFESKNFRMLPFGDISSGKSEIEGDKGEGPGASSFSLTC